MWTEKCYDQSCPRRGNDIEGLGKIVQYLRDPDPFHLVMEKDQDLHKERGHSGRFVQECHVR